MWFICSSCLIIYKKIQKNKQKIRFIAIALTLRKRIIWTKKKYIHIKIVGMLHSLADMCIFKIQPFKVIKNKIEKIGMSFLYVKNIIFWYDQNSSKNNIFFFKFFDMTKFVKKSQFKKRSYIYIYIYIWYIHKNNTILIISKNNSFKLTNASL